VKILLKFITILYLVFIIAFQSATARDDSEQKMGEFDGGVWLYDVELVSMEEL